MIGNDLSAYARRLVAAIPDKIREALRLEPGDALTRYFGMMWFR